MSIHRYLSYGHPKTIKKENKQDFDIFQTLKNIVRSYYLHNIF